MSQNTSQVPIDVPTTVASYSHDEHGLKLINEDRSSYKCNGCKELGFGDRYICDDEKCPYILHPDCLFHKEEATHKFLEGSAFKFFEKHSNNEHRSCVACGSDIKGYFYHCDVTNKNLHPCCLNLQNTIRVDKIKFRLCDRLTSPCFYCYPEKNQNMDSCWCYVSKRCQNSQAHVSCMKNAINKCLNDKSKKDEMSNIKRKISELLKRAKMLLKDITKFLKSSKPYIEDISKFMKSAKTQLKRIVVFLESLEKAPLKKWSEHLGSVKIGLDKASIILELAILILDGIIPLFSGEVSDHCQKADQA